MPRIDKFVASIAVFSLLLIGGITVWAVTSEKNSPAILARDRCVAHGAGASYHVHQNLEIYASGEPVKIPANIGITPSCMKALHTHDDTGRIHVEYPRQYDFTLTDFFANWGQAFSKNQILDRVADRNHEISLTVEDQKSEEYENLVLKDGQKIVIRFEEKREASPSGANNSP